MFCCAEPGDNSTAQEKTEHPGWFFCLAEREARSPSARPGRVAAEAISVVGKRECTKNLNLASHNRNLGKASVRFFFVSDCQSHSIYRTSPCTPLSLLLRHFTRRPPRARGPGATAHDPAYNSGGLLSDPCAHMQYKWQDGNTNTGHILHTATSTAAEAPSGSRPRTYSIRIERPLSERLPRMCRTANTTRSEWRGECRSLGANEGHKPHLW